jgi:DNA-binding response OmpR family regulator
MTTETDTARVLVVDDEQDIADLYGAWLTSDYDIVTAYDGREAIERVDEHVDVALLDRQMPEYSGDEVLEHIDEQGLDCRTVMVTAVDPDFDIVEMPFDDYLTKPVTREELTATVEEMLTRHSYDETLQQYFSVAAKKATLEAEKHPAELEASEDYTEISDRVDELRQAADSTVEGIDDYESAFRELGSE